MAHESRVNSPGSLVVVLVFPSGFLHVKISVTRFRLYIKWSLVLKHVCARGGGGGNVTFGVYNSSRLIVVSVRHSGPLLGMALRALP